MNQDIEEKLARFREFKPNWDGYDASPISDVAIANVKAVLSILKEAGVKPPQVFPISDGGVQLEWKGGKRELEIEFKADGLIEYFVCNSFKIDDLEKFQDLVNWVNRNEVE